jgi:Ca-activated chloride channel family protein
MSEQSVAVRSGLFTADAVPVPLAGVAIRAELSGFCARVSVTQRYVNHEHTPIEAVYVFPLDEGAAVCGFEAIVDGTLVVGEVKPREQAFESYDKAIEEGHGAFLLDEERPDVFQASVGNLPPGKEVLLKLTYVTELNPEQTGLRFSIPTTVSPRYAPLDDQRGVGRPDSEALNPPLAWRVPYGLELTVHLAMPGSITRIESPSHPVAVVMNGSTAAVTLSQRDAALDREFVLSVDAEGLDSPSARLERDDDGAESVALGFAPRLPGASAPAEIIFLVDRSGSMEGTSITEVRNALQLCLRSMIAGCRFNIIGFGSRHEPLFPGTRAYDESSLAEASAHVGAMQADMGGTEILPALRFALEQPRGGALPRQVVVLTDGQVTNTDAVLALAKQHAAGARIFAFGIGAGASHHLVKGLARAGGTAEFIAPGERIEPKIVRQFGRLLSPVLTDVRVDWGGLQVTQAPSAVPPIFSGGRLLLYGFLGAGRMVSAPAVARLLAHSPEGPVTFEVAIEPARLARGRTVATLAARARIRELEEDPAWTPPRGSRQADRKAGAINAEIVALATKYGLVSRETSYVAIERRDTPVVGDVQLRRIPVALTAGWGGLEARRFERMMVGHAASRMPDQGPPARIPFPARSARHFDTAAFAFFRTTRHDSCEPEETLAHPPIRPVIARAASPVPAPPEMHALVALQHADGSWDLTSELADAIGVPLARLESAIASASGNRDDIRRAWATALALAWLRAHARHVEEEWKLLAHKGRKWLDDVDAMPPGRGAWIDAARRYV